MSSPAPFNDARTRLTAANLGVPIAWPNETFDHPDPPAPWLAVDITSDVLEPISLPADDWQEDGTLYVIVCVPSGSGSDAARTLAKQVANVFRGVTGQVIYTSGSIGNGTISEQSGIWWSITVTVRWQYQDTTTGV